MSDTAVADTRRLNSKPQDLTDAYGPPSNFLEIDIFNPQTVGVGRARFTTYEVRMRVSHGVRSQLREDRAGRGQAAMGTDCRGEDACKGHLGVRGRVGFERGLQTRLWPEDTENSGGVYGWGLGGGEGEHREEVKRGWIGWGGWKRIRVSNSSK